MKGDPRMQGRPRWRRGLLVLAIVMAGAGCGTPRSASTEVPGESSSRSGRSDDVDDRLDARLSAEEAEKAAMKAAAQKVLDKVNDRDPEEEKKKMAKSRVMSARAQAQLDNQQRGEAVKLAREALKVHEQNVEAMLVIAEVYFLEGKYELTRAVTSSALQVDIKIRTPKDSSRAYNLQGFAALAMGEQTVATQLFKKAAEADDRNAAAWNNLGTRYLDSGDVKTATACFQYAIELDPGFAKAQLNYGASLRAQGQWTQAESTIQKALKLQPGYAEAYFNLGVLYLDADPFPGLDTTQRLGQAIKHLKRYRELAGSTSSLRFGAASRLRAEGAANAPPPPVSPQRADDYIRVANKGLEREARRLEREQGRSSRSSDAPTSANGPASGGAVPSGSAGDASSLVTKPAGERPTRGRQAGKSDPTQSPPASPNQDSPGSTGEKPPMPGPKVNKPMPSKPRGSGPKVNKPTPSKLTGSGPKVNKPTPSPKVNKPKVNKPTPSKPTGSGPKVNKPTPSKPTGSGPKVNKPTPGPKVNKPKVNKPMPSKPTSPAPSGQSSQSASFNRSVFEGRSIRTGSHQRGTRWRSGTLTGLRVDASFMVGTGDRNLTDFEGSASPSVRYTEEVVGC